jgi:hypoxanthine phosphoribosyltransferase
LNSGIGIVCFHSEKPEHFIDETQPLQTRFAKERYPFTICSVPELKVLLSREQIAERVAQMGKDISRDFTGQSVILLGVLKGAAIFLSDLARNVDLDATFDFIGVSSYGKRPSAVQVLEGTATTETWDSTGEVRLTKDVEQSLVDRTVILVEDILDTGLTLNYIQRLLRARKPRELRIAALLDKPSRRKQPIQAHYIGFTIPDEFVVGYGLDYAEKYRNLPDVCIFSQ